MFRNVVFNTRTTLSQPVRASLNPHRSQAATLLLSRQFATKLSKTKTIRKSIASSRRASKSDDTDSSGTDAPIGKLNPDLPRTLNRVILAEKPSVARDLARVLKLSSHADTKRGFFISDDAQTAVTWAFGHLVDWTDEDRHALRWSRKVLPILPHQFTLFAKLGGDGNPEPSAARQLGIITHLFRAANEIVVATDAGREGELIFRLIYELANCTTPFQRFWVSSQTDAALLAGFQQLRPGADLDRLYYAAWCRKAADWIVGINATQAYTLYFNRMPTARGSPLTVGRVQTPVLRMIVDRHHARESFVPRDYWTLHLDCEASGHAFRAQWFDAAAAAPDGDGESTRLWSEAQADQVAAALTPRCQVLSSKRERRTEKSPRLFDLTDLQKELNRRLGWRADKTLSTMQSLYETYKLVTYPRTSSRYIPRNMFGTTMSTLRAVIQACGASWDQLDTTKLDVDFSRVFDDTRVRDHFAIIPTGQSPPSNLPPAEAALYDIVVRRFVAAFMPDCLREHSDLVLTNAGHHFRAHGSRMIRPGWRGFSAPDSAADGAASDDASAANPSADPAAAAAAAAATATKTKRGGKGRAAGASDTLLPALSRGTEVAASLPPSRESHRTQPPPLHTDASLLHLMETAGRQIEDEELREAIKDCGIGTPATRAGIIEKLIRHGYVTRRFRSTVLLPTPRGLALISLLGDSPLSHPELTGRWELRLQRIETGQENREKFMDDIRDFTRTMISSVRDAAEKVEEEKAAQKARTTTDPATGATTSGAGDSDGVAGGAQTVGLVPQGTVAGACPVCSSGKVTAVGRAWRCTGTVVPSRSPSSSDAAAADADADADAASSPATTKRPRVKARVPRPKRCTFWVAQRIANVDITLDLMKTLLTDRQTPLVSGFVSKKNTAYAARLKLTDDGKLIFAFQ